MTSEEESHSYHQQLVCSIIPPMSISSHKGQAGRIGVFGGSREYTGAPYFAAISAMKVGADLSYVFCSSTAAPVIKSYSPELIVYPYLDDPSRQDELIGFLSRLHAVVIGPGLGRSDELLPVIGSLIEKAKELDLPMVLDADALHFVCQCPDIVKGCTKAILTPNVVEFDRLWTAVFGSTPEKELATTTDNNHRDNDSSLINLCNTLGGITILRKGKSDKISDGHSVVTVTEEGSPRRCGGQGDVTAGTLGTFSFWSQQAFANNSQLSKAAYGPTIVACLGASMLTRRCSKLAFAKHGRSTLLCNMLDEIRTAFKDLFPVD
ncbi:ATP-dependent (S)-NAD(P)H-hydrate dehydratase [Halotydeus destructor]|nr:ATP-dependent (S)-NAD(P)H-hydrate dehydratase [Halotydeus destructor]